MDDELAELPTEARNPRSVSIDQMPVLDILRLMNEEDAGVPAAVAAVLPDLARIVELAIQRRSQGGRIHYFGAGTSGRLAVLDAAELLPTFNIDSSFVIAHTAGGEEAIVHAVEDAEDSASDALADVSDVNSSDLVIGLSASGRTPYVSAALAQARSLGAATVLITANRSSPIAPLADIVLVHETGPEILTGSTRLKAGTAQKLVLNAFSTALMISMGRSWSNLMVSLVATNDKLRRRALRILTEATGQAEERCAAVMSDAGGRLDVALVAILAGCPVSRAKQVLEARQGSVHRALGDLGYASSAPEPLGQGDEHALPTMVAPRDSGLTRVLTDDRVTIPGERLAVIANHTSVTAGLRWGPDALIGRWPGRVVALLGLEHGFTGVAQAGQAEVSGITEYRGIPTMDTYGKDGSDLQEVLRSTGADCVVLDVQDIGTRFYTYTWTLFDALCAAAAAGIAFVVLDRPNPLGFEVRGPGVARGYESFVGRVSIPIRHGSTLGELARWFNDRFVPERAGRRAELQVIPASSLGLALLKPAPFEWISPSPNMPTLETAKVYAGTGLLEGTNISEGRGTTKPFEQVGAPWIDQRLVEWLRGQKMQGVLFRQAAFKPAFGKYAGTVCNGVQLHVCDPARFDAISVSLRLLEGIRELYPSGLTWVDGGEGPLPIDLLWGSPLLREAYDGGKSLLSLLEEEDEAVEFERDMAPYHLYPRTN